MKKLEEKILGVLIRLRNSEKGASAVEYALLVSLIAVVIIAAVAGLGTAVGTKLNAATSAINS
jgi:pilus assembly protein Flp/PilA